MVDALDDLMVALDELYGHHLAAAEELAVLNRDDELAGRLAGLTLSIGELFTALTRSGFRGTNSPRLLRPH